MASAFSHAILAGALGSVILPRPSAARVWIIGAACSIIPDVDVVGFWWGVPYGHMFGHRGITHSLLFAAALSLIVLAVMFRSEGWHAVRLRLFWYFFLATASHGVLDALTDGGLGVAFFAPFDNQRLFFPFHPVAVSPLSIASFFTSDGLRILASEAVWIWLPSVMLAVAGRRSRAS
jgi:inner membrane protein